MASTSYIKSAPSVYSTAQVPQWLQAIEYPDANSSSDAVESQLREGKFPTTLENLTLLNRLHLLAFPFENLDMHYSAKHDMDVTPEGSFQRMVVERKGSYCYGKNGLLLEMLRGLGYRAYTGQGRPNENLIEPKKEPEYSPLTHLVLFVQPFEGKDERKTYLVDTAFGGGGLVRPILLEDGATVAGGTSSETFKLSKGPHPKSVLDNPAALY
ncbi:hypothetical protein PM082_004791 [Marasmius tenuissimus]|nr:hypothetical protein PM082_004791 [Marasmius tenuissimus]